MAKKALPIMITIAVSALIAGYLVVQLRAERQSVAQLRAQAAALATPVAGPQSLAPAQPESPAPEHEIPGNEPPGNPAPAPANAPARQQIIVMRADGTPDTDPTAGARFQIRMFWGDIEKDLGFSAEQMEALVQLVARGNVTPAEFDAVTGGRYPELQERQRFGLTQNRVSNLRRQLASSPAPLTDQQEVRLQEAFMAEFRRTDEETAAYPRPTEARALLDLDAQRLRIAEASNERLMAAARTFLAPEQIAVVQGSLDSLLNSQRRSLETRRLQLEAGGSGAAFAAPLVVYPASATPVMPSSAPR